MSICGIYKITCTGNNQFYIGQSCEYFKRFWRHINDLKQQKHWNQRLQRCFNKYGEESFEVELFDICDVSQLDEREQYWIDVYFSDPLCMNMNPTASKPPNATGRITSEETKLKIGKANKGHKHTDVSKSLMSQAAIGHKRWVGKHHTEESKQKISKANESTVEKKLISPKGNVVVFCNTMQFCKQNGLDKGAVYRVLNNKAKSHRGWTKS